MIIVTLSVVVLNIVMLNVVAPEVGLTEVFEVLAAPLQLVVDLNILKSRVHNLFSSSLTKKQKPATPLVPGKSLRPSLIFESKGGTYYSGASFKCCLLR
jgi:hypothetical protein